MSYTWEDFEREYTSNFLESLSPQERLAGLKPTELLAGLTPEEIEDYLNRLKDEKKN